jgi:hypothetical protein
MGFNWLAAEEGEGKGYKGVGACKTQKQNLKKHEKSHKQTDHNTCI